MKQLLFILFLVVTLAGCGKESYDTYLTKGEAAFVQHDYTTALLEFKNAIQVNKTGFEARFSLFKVYMNTLNYKAAEKELNKAIEFGLPFNESIVLKARVFHYLKLGDELQKLPLNNDNDAVEVVFYQLYDLIKPNSNESRITTLISWFNQKERNSPFAKLVRVLIDLHNKDIKQAKIDASGDFPRGNIAFKEEKLLKTEVYLISNDLPHAIKQLSDYLYVYPLDNQRKLQLSDLLISNGQYKKAQSYLTPLAKLFPRLGLIAELQSVALFEQKKYKQAIEKTRIATVTKNNSIRARVIAAYSYVRLNKLNDALTSLSFIVDDLPENSSAKRLYLKLKMDTGNLADIADQALSLTDLKSTDIGLLSSVALTLMQQGDVDSAQKIEKKLSKINTTKSTGEGGAALGLLQLSLNNNKGLETIKQAFDVSPDSLIVNQTYASALLAQNKYKEVLTLANTWLKSPSTELQGYMMSGVVLLRQSKVMKALDNFNQALRIDPEYKQAISAKIETLILLSQTPKAEQLLVTHQKKPFFPFLLQHYLAAKKNDKTLDEGVTFAWGLIANANKLNQTDIVMLTANASFLTKKFNEIPTRLLPLKDTKLKYDPNYWLLLGASYEKQRNSEEALKSYLSWLKKIPTSKQALMSALKMYSSMRKYNQAILLLDQYAINHKDQTPINLLKIHFYLADFKWENAQKIYNQLSEQVKSSTIGQGIEGILSFSKGEYAIVVDKLLPLYNKAPSERYLKWLVVSMGELGRDDEVISLLEEHIKTNPSGFALFMLGNAYIGKGEANLALISFKEANKLTPNNPLLLNNFAYTLWKEGRNIEAIKYAKQALKLSPNRPELVDTLANAYLSENNIKEAINVLRDAYNEYPTTSGDQFSLTYIKSLLLNNRKKDALDIFSQHKWQKSTMKEKANKLFK